MADELDFSGALDRVLQQQDMGAPTAPAAPAASLAPTTNLLTGAAPTPSPFAAALDQVIRGDTAPLAPAAPDLQAAEPTPVPGPDDAVRAAQEAASGVAAANGLLSEGVRPEVIAEIRRISRDQNIPLPLAAQTYIERAQAAPGARYHRLLQQNPGLRRIASQGAAYADFLPDAAELATTEQAFTEAQREWSVGAVAGSVAELGDRLEDTLVGRAITRGTLQTLAALPTLGASLELGVALDIGSTEEQILERLAAPYGGWAAMENYPASMRMSVLAAARQQYNLVQGLTEDDRAAALQRAGEYFFSAGELVAQAEGLVRNPGSQSFITNTLSQAPNTVVGTLDAFASDPVNGGLFLAETILESAPNIAATIVVSRVTGSLALGAAVGATTGGGREYVLSTTQFLAERGYTINSVEDAVAILQNAELMQEAADFGFARAIPIAILDGLAGVASGVRLGRTAIGDVAGQTVVQATAGGTGEALAQLASEGEISSPRDITIEALAELPTALIEVPLAAGRSFGSERLPPELNQLLAPGALQSAADQAAAAQQSLETARAAIEETATFARDPEAVRELLVAAGDQEVSIPVQEIERLYQEGALTDDDIAYLNVEDELTQQGELSGDVVTTASRVLTLQGDAFARLSEHVRTQAGAPTAAEARADLANREADIARLQGVLEQAQNVEGEINTLADTITEQLRATRTLSRGQSRAAARLLAERYAARAALFEGVTATELYERDAVTFAGPGAPLGAPTMEQPSVEVAPDQDVVGLEGLRLLHGTPRADLTLADIEIVREGAKQGRRGRRTGGFYTTAVADAAQAEGYARMTGEQGQLMDVIVAPGTRILRIDSDITRLSEAQVNEWTGQGYGLVIGKDVRGRTEYVIIDRDAIQSLTPTGAAPDALEQEGLSLFANPLPIEGRATVRAIGEAMTQRHMETYGRKFYPEDSPEDYALVLADARAELAEQMAQPNSGHGWYSKDVDLAIQQTARILPGLDTPEGRAVFLTFAGIYSNGLDPQQAWQVSIEAYEAFQATGEIVINRADAARAVGREPPMTTYKDKDGKRVTKEAGWGPRNPANEQQLEMFKTLIEQKGSPVAALDWLVNPQPREAINQLMADAGVKTPRFKTKAEREGPPTYGALIFSEKLGRYTLGLHGVPVGSEDTTVDLWYTRTYRRWTGRLLDKPLGKEGVAAQPDPARGGIERQTIFRLTGDLMQDYPELTAGDVQAMLWFFEKRLWGAQGLRTDEGTNSAGARQALERRGLEFDERGGSGAARAEGGADVTFEQAALDAGGTGSYSGGGLAPLEGAPNVVGASGPDPELVAVAERYAAENGIDLRRQAEFVEVDPERAARIAQAYEEMEHAPQDPAVQAAYADLIAQTIAQYQALVDAGYSFTFFDSETDPYDGNPWNAMRDLRANKTMAVYGTYDGYGTEGLTQGAVDDNPMLQDTGLVWKDQNGVDRPVTANDLFRAVHDAFGHGIEGAGFRARGEENAWQAHVRLFTGDAIAAITSETRGQNSWLNYGPYGEQNRTAAVEDTVFADQKTGLMPEFTWTEGRAGDAPVQETTNAAETSLLDRGISPDPAAVRGRGAAAGAAAAEGVERAGAGLADQPDRDPRQQPVTAEDLGRLDDEAFLREFLTRPGWGAVTASLSLPDTEFYRNQRDTNPALYELSVRRQEERNRAENERLRSMLDQDGIAYLTVQGMYQGEPDGTSYIIAADEATVTRLGRSFGQDSVLTRDGLIFTQRAQADVQATGDVMVGEQALAEDFYSVTPGGTQFSMGLAFGTSGPGVPRIPAGYTQRADRPQLPVRPDGTVELFHWSGSELATVDPAFAGTGPLQGAERKRGARVSFFGINPRERTRSQGTGYVKESGLGPVRHVAFVEADALYPLFEDPEGLADGKDIGAAEGAIRAAGYLGYYTTDDGSGRAPLGNVAVLFEAVPVQVVPPEAQPLEQPTEGPQTPERGAVGAPRGSYTLPTSDDPRNLITLSANADPSTFVHEVGHMFLFQMLRDIADPRITTEGKAQLEAQIAATRAWFSSNAAQGLADLKALAKSMSKRAAAAPDDTELQLRASRLNAAVQRAEAGGGAAYMEQVAQAFMDPAAPGRDEAAEVVYHELWSRGFERYLGTGSAPSAELRGVFAKFAKYITSIYKSLRRLNVTVSPEVADVFDRLLATEEAITQERRGAMYQLSPGVLEGATPAEANQLRKLAAEAEEQARTEMAARVENSLKAEARAQRRTRREQLANEIAEQVAAEPVYAATNIAKRGVMPDGTKTGTGKIDRAELVAVAGEEAVARMPAGMVSGRVRPDNAIPLGDLATLSGFPDIYSMIEALTNPTPTPEATAVKERTDAAMLQEFGADLDAGALQTKAVEVVQNDKFQQLQQLQLRILRRLAAQPMARIAQRQAEQEGAPAAAVDRAATEAAQAEQAAARTPREGVQAALARIRADVQRTANASQRRAQVAARRQTASIRLGMDPAAITAAAQRYVRTIKVKDATPARYRQAAARLTAKIERAIADRDYTQAATLMEQRALNLAVAKEASIIQTKIEAQRTRWREVTARSDKRLAQRYSIDWINAIRVVLEPFGMARNMPRNYDPTRALADLQAVEPTLYTEIQLAISTYAARSQAAAQANPNNPYKDLSVQEALDLLETADTMLANARDSHGVLIEGRRIEFGTIADEVAVNVGQRRKVQKQAGRIGRGRGSRTFRETRRQLGAFKASLRRIEQWARDFDNGNPRGPLTRYLVRPVMAAVDAYSVARKGPQEALAALLRKRTDLMARRPIRAPELDGYVFQTKGELIMALLHTGNDSNKRKLLLGGATDVETNRRYVWGSQDADGNLDTSRWDTFVDRLFADGTLTQADMELVQGIWDIFEQTKKAAQAAHKQMYGYYFAEVQADPVVTPFGIYPGGYAPAITDSMMNPDGARFEAEEVMSQQSSASMFPGAEKGFTQSRVEYNQPLDLDLTRIPAHFDRVMKFAYLGPAVRQAARLVTNKQFREAVRPGSPDVIDVAVIPWLQRTVQQRVTTPPTNQGWSGLSKVAAAIDRRVGLHIMAGNLVNAAQQITGFPVAAARIPARHLAVAATRWRVNTQSARAYIIAQSPFMEDRLTGGMNEASTTLDRILSEPGLLNKAQNAAMRYGYFAQQIAQNLVDPTVWLAAERHGMAVVYPAAYADALARTGDEAAADTAARAEVVAYADSVVRDTQAPLRPSDVSGIEASSPLARLFLKFYSYFNAMGNLLVTEKNIAMNSDMGWAGRYGRSFYAYLMIVTIPSIVAESIAQLARSGFDDLEDEDERDQLMFQLLIGSQIKTMAAMVPFAGSVVSTAYGIVVTDQIYDDRISLSAGIGVTESTLQGVIRLIAAAADPNTDVETQRAIKTTLDAMGLALGLPVNWASKPISYAISVNEGDSRPEGLVDIIQGALTGRDGTDR